ncbi:MAG: CsbD family protein [Acidisphaera sp.]|nr:CsbD family protein [Acidisphaera sp.]MBV9812744.1 CsbD family protein [Acetobacteraceae bacterium]
MDQNRVTGTAKDMYGRAQETVGDIVGDARTQGRGQLNQARGQAEDALGQVKDYAREQPLTAILIGVGVGYLLGRLRLL